MMNQVDAHVLLVDDSLTVRMDLTEVLEAAQLRVTACTTAAEARAALAQERFGLIILDVVLPDGDGVDLLEEIRETAALNGVAVILLSDESQVRDRVRGLTTGADEYIGKPYDARYVVASAHELLRRSRKTGAAARETILVIDDSRTFCEQMKEALEGASYRVLTAGSGEAGLRLAAHERPAAIIIDRTLPGIDGVGVLRGIRLDAALRQIPCILLTASEDKSDEVEALDAGADAFVRKDEDIAIILARLSAVLRNSRDAYGADAVKASLQGPKRILVVDGNDAYLRQVAGQLRDEGYEVVQARTGEEGFDLLSAQSVDCILLDLDMPGIGSQETCRRIRGVSFSSDTPIIMTVAQDDREAIIRCLAAGADDYIGKAGEFAVLRARVLAQIRRKQFEDENRLIREQLALKEGEAAQARAARERGAMQERTIARCQSETALWELFFGLAQDARWSAMDMATARLSGELAAALRDIRGCLGHVRRAVKTGGLPQAGHFGALLDKADAHAGDAEAAVEKSRAAIARHVEARARESLNDVVQDVVAPVADGWGAELNITVTLAPSLPAVFVNRLQIQQALAGLLRNALEAMRNARRRDLVVATGIGPAGTVHVAVSDTGGTPVADRASLDSDICRSILESHGGCVRFAANEPAGTTVTLELPAAAAR